MKYVINGKNVQQFTDYINTGLSTISESVNTFIDEVTIDNNNKISFATVSESNKQYHKLSEALTLYKLFTTHDKIYDEHTFTQDEYTIGLNKVIDVCISNHKLYVRLFDWKKTAKCPIDKSSADKQKLGYVNRLFKV